MGVDALDLNITSVLSEASVRAESASGTISKHQASGVICAYLDGH